VAGNNCWIIGWLNGMQISSNDGCDDSERSCIAVNGTPSHGYCYGVSLSRWNHAVLPVTQHKRRALGDHTNNNLGDWLHAIMVYLSPGGHPSKY